MANIYNAISCPQCGNHDFVKKGLNGNKTQICLMCKACHKRFQVDANADKTMPLEEEQWLAAHADTVETVNTTAAPRVEAARTVATETTETTETGEQPCVLYGEDGKVIHLPSGMAPTKENIIQFCNDRDFMCTPIDEDCGLYKAQTRRTHSKG